MIIPPINQIDATIEVQPTILIPNNNCLKSKKITNPKEIEDINEPILKINSNGLFENDVIAFIIRANFLLNEYVVGLVLCFITEIGFGYNLLSQITRLRKPPFLM